jgi:hypothetical protein
VQAACTRDLPYAQPRGQMARDAADPAMWRRVHGRSACPLLGVQALVAARSRRSSSVS